MELLLEIVMCVFLDAAMLVLLLNVFREETAAKKRYRLVSATFAIGFLCGTLAQILFGGSIIVMVLFALGFMLAYTAFVFTVPERRKHDEGR